VNHLTQTQQPKRDADEFDTPHDGVDHYSDFDQDHDSDKEDRLPRMRRPRPQPRRRASHPTPEGYYDHPEDPVPDAVGSPDLLDRVEELKRLQGGGRYPHPHKNDFYEDAHHIDDYRTGHDHHDTHNYKRHNNRNSWDRTPLPAKSSGGFSHDHAPLPPFKPTKGDVKNSVSKVGDEDQYDGMDYYDYGPYGPVTADIPKRISKKIEYMKDLRKNSPLSDDAVREEEKARTEAQGAEDPSTAAPPQEVAPQEP